MVPHLSYLDLADLMTRVWYQDKIAPSGNKAKWRGRRGGGGGGRIVECRCTVRLRLLMEHLPEEDRCYRFCH